MIPELRIKTNKTLKHMLIRRIEKLGAKVHSQKIGLKTLTLRARVQDETVTDLENKLDTAMATITRNNMDLSSLRASLLNMEKREIAEIKKRKRFEARCYKLTDKLEKSQGTG
jgi:hypothetical protein